MQKDAGILFVGAWRVYGLLLSIAERKRRFDFFSRAFSFAIGVISLATGGRCYNEVVECDGVSVVLDQSFISKYLLLEEIVCPILPRFS